MLETYRAVSGYTTLALEDSIKDLKSGIASGKFNSETEDLLKDRLNTLEEYLVEIELDF